MRRLAQPKPPRRPAEASDRSPSSGLVVAAHRAAATAGASALDAGGTAVDAAVAAALALCVVDPANCGIGGYGGFMTVQLAPGAPASRVDFNTAVPAGLTVASLRGAPRSLGFARGGASVSVPAVVPGLGAAHERFGRLPFESLVQSALALARGGFAAGRDLVRSLEAVDRDGGLSSGLLGPAGRIPRIGETVRQPRLAQSLEELAARGPGALRKGPLVDAICDAAQATGGALAPEDLAQVRPTVSRACSACWADATVHAPAPEESGAGVLLEALERLDPRDAAGRLSAVAVVRALRRAWSRRRASVRPLVAWPGNTTHLCAADASGGLVSLTFTHGPLWFGSGVLAGESGIVLNAGANVFARCGDDGEIRAVANVCPVIVEGPGDERHALGSPGGHRIPAIVLGVIVDVAARGFTLADALARPRVAVTPSGEAEAEPGAPPLAGPVRRLSASDFFGPATGVTLQGQPVPALDPRFEAAVEVARAHHDDEGRGRQV